MNIGQRIKNLRKELKLSADDLAEKLGKDRSTIYRYENGDIGNFPIDILEPLAKVLQTTPAYLMGWTEKSDPQELNNESYFNLVRRIPILGRVSAGLPLYASEHIEGYTYTELNHGKEYFGLRVKGDSMNAANIYDGNILIIRRQPTVENGQIAVVLVNGSDATVKRFYRNGDQVTLMPQSTNSEHQPQVYNLKETTIEILGKVVQNQIMYE